MTDTPALLPAAGILFIADGRILLVQRAAGSDHVGEWCVPGGCVEEGETSLQAALRESAEEVGYEGTGVDSEWCRRIAEGVDYTTFLARIEQPFKPVLQHDECSDARWFLPAELPPNIHPGTKVAIAKLGMDELALAEAIRDGELVSPIRYQNVWLFDMRITGTGACYRTADGGEFAWRDPSYYLNDRFLKRCAGLAVIWEHPDKSMLTSQEFADRAVGAMLLPYIKGEDVWGIAKVYDDGAAEVMRDRPMSTSPAVVLRKADDKVRLEDGTELLIEGEPALLDHLAICERGVWDKLQAPSGINYSGDISVAEDTEEKMEDKKVDASEELMEDKKDAKKADASEDDKEEAKADADTGSLDKFLSKLDAKMDAVCSRLDALEGGSKADAAGDEDEEKMAKEVAADKSRKDSKKADAEDEEKKADAARTRADSVKTAAENADLRKRLAALEAGLASTPKLRTDADITEFAAAQARADSVYGGFGTQAPEPLRGEDPLAYRRRLAHGVQKHSTRWGAVDLLKLDAQAFGIAEEQVYADAMAEASNPADLPVGELREISRVDRSTGQRQITFAGRNTFITGMKRPAPRARISSRPNQTH